MKAFTARRRPVLALALGAVVASAGIVTAAGSAQAAAGCQVGYAITGQWSGGFTATIRITNLGDPINGWRLGWTFPAAGQTVLQAWGFTASPASGDVVATNVDYDAAIASNATLEVGFNGSWTTSNPSPTSFTLNGTACTGSVPPTTAPPTSAPPTTAPPTSAPPTSAPPTTAPPPSTAPPTSTPPTTGTPTVAADGTGKYRTVQAAIDAVPVNNSQRVVITIKPGTYRQVVTVPANKPNITLQGLGSSPANTLLVYNNPASSTGTFNSASMFVNGANFVAENLSISNDYDENKGSSQAVALNLNADRAVLRNVRLLGDQDTFLVNVNARAYVVSSYIEGTVDFIFGDGTAVFNACSIYEKRSSGQGPITAARTDPARQYGFLIYKSTITGAANNVTYLGRPWGPNAQVLFRESSLSATIHTSQPWMDMSGNVWQNARFFEYRNTGAGAGVNGNRPQMSDSQAANYTPQRYLAGNDGWNPM